jgi:hypothetical protein
MLFNRPSLQGAEVGTAARSRGTASGRASAALGHPTFEEGAFVGLAQHPKTKHSIGCTFHPATFTFFAATTPCNPPLKQALAHCITYYMDIRRGVSRLLMVLWVVYGLWLAWGSYNAQGHITKEWIVWSLAVIIVPLLVVYFIVKIVEWIIAGFRTPKHPLQHQP